MTEPADAQVRARASAASTSSTPAVYALSPPGSHPAPRSFAHGAITLFDRDLRFVSASAFGLVDVGLSKELIEGRTIFEVFSPEVAEVLEPLYRLALEGGEAMFDVSYAGRQYVQHLSPLRDADGVIFAGMGFTEEAVARPSEEAVRASEECFRVAFEHAPIGMALIDLDGRHLRVNAVMCQITGRSEAELVTLDVAAITHPEDLAADLACMAELVRDERASYSLEKRYLTAAGETVWVSKLASLVRQIDGSPLHFITQVQNITAARRTEQALHDSELRFRMAFDNGPIGRALIGLDGRYERANAALCAITGYSEEELVGMTVAELTHPDDRVRTELSIIQPLDSDEVSDYALEKRYLTASGDVTWVLATGSLVRREDGTPVDFITQVQDISGRKEHERLLAEERRRLHEAQVVGRVGSWERDLATGVTVWSDTFFDLYGLDRKDFEANYTTALHCTHPDDREMVAAASQACGTTGEPMRVRHRVTRPHDGQLRIFDARADALYEDGQLTRVAGTVVDVTDQVLAEQALVDSEMRFRLAFDTAPIAMAMIDLSGDSTRLLRVNPAMCALTGRSEDDLRFLDFAAISHPDDTGANAAMIAQLSSGRSEVVRAERRFVRPDASTVWGELAMSVVTPADGRGAYGICLIDDISARKVTERALVHQSMHDPLTGLANRALLADRIAHALGAAQRSRLPIGLCCIDLDGFKQVNDSAGHAAGDELLVEVADRLRHTLRPGDTVARLGGDEFAVVCIDVADLDRLSIAAARMLATLALPFRLSGGTHHISASIGLAISGEGCSADQLLRDADGAMYAAKRAGRNRVATPRPEEQARATRAARLLPELHDAIEHGQFVMFGQPVIDLASGLTIAVETLIRWRHPARGVLAPGAFLDVVEHNPLMLAVGQFALDDSCRMAASWARELGTRAPDVHVNVSGRQLESEHLASDVLITLATFALPADRLVLELTETHMPEITDTLRGDLDRLRSRGVRIAIDDLGTGYSSLERITELPVDILKIDLRFVAGLGKDPACDAVVRAILSIGQAMGLAVVAEGVETLEQAELLRGYGCDTAQGYLYSAGLPETELLGYLGGQRPRPLMLPTA